MQMGVVTRASAGMLVIAFAASTVAAQDLILHWTFDEPEGGNVDVIDEGVNAEKGNGILFGQATRTTNTPGESGGFALDLSAEGVENTVWGDDLAEVDTLEAFTMTMWINLQGTNADQGGSNNVRLLAKQSGGDFNGFSWNLNTPNEGENSTDNFKLGMFIGGENGFVLHQSTEDMGADDTWAFIAYTYDGSLEAGGLGNSVFYVGYEDETVRELGDVFSIDGGRVKSTAAGLDDSADFGIGFTDADPGRDYSINGYQDDIRIYDGWLEIEDIEQIRLAGLGSVVEFSPCDFNQDGAVDASDAGFMFGVWDTDDATADKNDDGVVDAADAGQLFAEWTGEAPVAAAGDATASYNYVTGLIEISANGVVNVFVESNSGALSAGNADAAPAGLLASDNASRVGLTGFGGINVTNWKSSNTVGLALRRSESRRRTSAWFSGGDLRSRFGEFRLRTGTCRHHAAGSRPVWTSRNPPLIGRLEPTETTAVTVAMDSDGRQAASRHACRPSETRRPTPSFQSSNARRRRSLRVVCLVQSRREDHGRPRRFHVGWFGPLEVQVRRSPSTISVAR